MRIVKAGPFCFAAGVVELKNITAGEFVSKVFEKHGDVQLINAEMVYDWDVLDAALLNAVMAYESGTMRARNVVNEVVMRLAGTTQFEEAIRRIGVREDTQSILYITASTDVEDVVKAAYDLVGLAGGVEKDSLHGLCVRLEELLEMYGIGVEQLSAVQANAPEEAVKLLILQKMATLNLP